MTTTDPAGREIHASHDPEPEGERLSAGSIICRRCCHFLAFTGTSPMVTRRGVEPCHPTRLDLRSGQPLPPRMRTYRGRVMHTVEIAGNGDLRSACTRRDRWGNVAPRATGRAEDWSADRHWYPDCTHCPPPVAGLPEEDS